MNGVRQTVQIDETPGGFRRFVRVTLRWTAAWALLGTALGLLMMFGKAPMMAESGSKPDDLGFYAFWVPVGAIFGMAGGLLTGALYAIVASINETWAAHGGASESFSDRQRRVACGAVTGALLALTFVRDLPSFIAGALLIGLTVTTSLYVKAA